MKPFTHWTKRLRHAKIASLFRHLTAARAVRANRRDAAAPCSRFALTARAGE